VKLPRSCNSTQTLSNSEQFRQRVNVTGYRSGNIGRIPAAAISENRGVASRGHTNLPRGMWKTLGLESLRNFSQKKFEPTGSLPTPMNRMVGHRRLDDV
jgi:hypothetical protein